MQAWTPVARPGLPGRAPTLRLYDTARGRVEPTAPGPTARMYVCGITPYDATHLGHAATYLAFDLVHRLWLDAGHTVHYVQNVTDIDDPLLERAARDQDDWVVLGMRETALFREDMEYLRVLPPQEFPGAVEAIPEIVELVGKLLSTGAAYRVDDPEYPDVYFDHRATERFGRAFGALSGLDEQTMHRLSGQRGGDPERPGKRHPVDALLWRVCRAGEPCWESELGPGRPGWHVECSVLALNRLGLGFDVQGGGSDLVFPHHEFSAAHAEALTGEHPFARHYCHAGMIGLDGQKMSKSRGNLLFVSRLRADGLDPMVLRVGLLSGHYRADRSWSDELAAQARQRLDRWAAAVDRPVGAPGGETVERLRARLADDLDTPGALQVLDAWADDTLRGTERGLDDPDAPRLVRDAVDALLGVRLG